MASSRCGRQGRWSSAGRASFRWPDGAASLLAGALGGSAAPTPDTAFPVCGFCGRCGSFGVGMLASPDAAGGRAPGRALRGGIPAQTDAPIAEIITDIHIDTAPLSSTEGPSRSAGVPNGFASGAAARSAAHAESAGPPAAAAGKVSRLSVGGFCGAGDVRGPTPGALRNRGLSGRAALLSGLTDGAFSCLVDRALAGLTDRPLSSLVCGSLAASIGWVLRRTSCRLALSCAPPH